jgi:hypothetical protein
MLQCWSSKDLLSFFCLPQNCVSVGYNKLLFHEQYYISENLLIEKKCVSDKSTH